MVYEISDVTSFTVLHLSDASDTTDQKYDQTYQSMASIVIIRVTVRILLTCSVHTSNVKCHYPIHALPQFRTYQLRPTSLKLTFK